MGTIKLYLRYTVLQLYGFPLLIDLAEAIGSRHVARGRRPASLGARLRRSPETGNNRCRINV